MPVPLKLFQTGCREEEGIKHIQLEKEEVKLFADGMILSMENSRLYQKLFEIMTNSVKLQNRKSTCKSLQGLYILSANTQKKKPRKPAPFTIVSKTLGIHLSKEMKELYTRNYKTLKKESEADINKQKAIYGLEELTLLKMSVLTKKIYSASPSKSQWHFSQKQKTNSKVCKEP